MTKILLASRNANALALLRKSLAPQSAFDVHVRLINNGHIDPLYGLSFQPDLVVLHCDSEHLDELGKWNSSEAGLRPPLIVVGPADNAQVVRLAMRVGAKDFLSEPIEAADVLSAVIRVRDEGHATPRGPAQSGHIHVFIGAAGGTGTSFLAANVARLATGSAAVPPMLVDLDLVLAPLSHFLELHPERGLLEAMDAAETLDQMALSGFGATHRSGLRLLCATPNTTPFGKEVSAERLQTLLGRLVALHPHVFVDASHGIDTLGATAIGLATHVILVLQQSVLQVRNATRLLQILRSEFAVTPDRLRIIVNRHQKDAMVQLDDIRRSLNVESIFTVPSHYRSALESADTGVLLVDAARTASVARAMERVATEILGMPAERPTGLLSRVLPAFLRS